MTATATERWSDRKFVRRADNFVATRAWDVIDADTEEDARAAIDLNTGSPVPIINDPHPSNERLKVLDVGCDRNGFRLWKLTAQYLIPTDGTAHWGIGTVDDPLLLPYRVRWRTGTITQAIDKDAWGNPILNSAGFPFAGSFNREFTVKFMEITRYEPFYDIQKALTFEGTVNSNDWQFTNSAFSLQPGMARLVSMMPVEDFSPLASIIRIAYLLEIRGISAQGNQVGTVAAQVQGFKLRILDQSNTAYYTVGGVQRIGNFFDTLNHRAHGPVLLNGSGQPLQSGWKVGDGMNSYTADSKTLPSNVTKDTTSAAVFLQYDLYPQIDFTGLGL